jgi:hypothetical protein
MTQSEARMLAKMVNMGLKPKTQLDVIVADRLNEDFPDVWGVRLFTENTLYVDGLDMPHAWHVAAFRTT